MQTQNRNPIIDYSRGIAMFLVLWGHSIQCIGGDGLFFQNPLVKCIYSFHMPLFMMISGYLFYFGKNQKFSVILRKRLISLGFPFVVWGILLYMRQCLFAYVTESTMAFSLQGILRSLISGPWFLKSVFIISIVVAVLIKLSGMIKLDYKLRYGLFGILWLLLIVGVNIVGDHTADLFPFFILGFAMAEYPVVKEKLFAFRYVVYALFAILLVFFKSDYLVYVSGVNPVTSDYGFWRQIEMDAYRLITGIAGSLSVIFAVKVLNDNKNIKFTKSQYRKFSVWCSKVLKGFFQMLGKQSLQVYVLQCFLLEGVLSQFVRLIANRGGGSAQNSFLLDTIFSLITAIIYSITLLIISRLIERIPFFTVILFGKKSQGEKEK